MTSTHTLTTSKAPSEAPKSVDLAGMKPVAEVSVPDLALGPVPDDGPEDFKVRERDSAHSMS